MRNGAPGEPNSKKKSLPCEMRTEMREMSEGDEGTLVLKQLDISWSFLKKG
jgi:hypothetical protein